MSISLATRGVICDRNDPGVVTAEVDIEIDDTTDIELSIAGYETEIEIPGYNITVEIEDD